MGKYVTCSNAECNACHPKDDGIPRLHGWITPERAQKMIDEMAQWLLNIGEIVPYGYHWPPVFVDFQTKQVYFYKNPWDKKCPSTTTNAQTAE